MRATALSLLFAATWLASTVFALVARNLNHQARADQPPEYPQGYDAKTCPLDGTPILLSATSAGCDATMLPAAVLSPARVPSSMTQRDLTTEALSQVCRQVARFPFRLEDHPLRCLNVETSTLQPGLYIVSVDAHTSLRSLFVAQYVPPFTVYFHGNYNGVNRIGGQFQIHTPVRLRMMLVWWGGHGLGEIGLFKLGPKGYVGPSS